MLEIQDGNIPQSQRGPNHSDVCPGLQFSPDTHRRNHTPKRPQQIKSWESKGETWKFQFLLCYKFSKYEEICQMPLIIYSELMTNREMPPEQFMDSVSPKSDRSGKEASARASPQVQQRVSGHTWAGSHPLFLRSPHSSVWNSSWAT